MASTTPPAKRIKTEPGQNKSTAKFKVGDKVYKAGLPETSKKTLFEITDTVVMPIGRQYYIKNDEFMGEGATMLVRESQLFTVKHTIGTKIREEVRGSHRTTHADATIVNWNFVDGEVVYDLQFNGSITREDKAATTLQIGWLDGVKVNAMSTNFRRYDYNDLLYPGTVREHDHIVSRFEVGLVKATADQLGTVVRG
jgi:hypothetical protein